MTRLSVRAPGLVALTLSPAPAQARAGLVTYSYSGSGSIEPGTGTGSLTGSFQVDQSVVASGHIHLSDLQNVSFTFSVTGHSPDITYTSIAAIGGNNGVIDVNAQGLPTSLNILEFPDVDNPYGQGSSTFIEGGVSFNHLGTFPSDGFDFQYHDFNNPGNEFSVDGGGRPAWTVTFGPAAVPEPSALALLAAGAAGLALRRLSSTK
jgi:hypothetical protein